MTYEYACAACGNQWETEQSISAKPLKKCPKCGKPQAKRLVSGGTGFLLKGGGWYADGYGSSKPASGKGESSEASSSSTTETAKDSPKKDAKKKTDGKGSQDKSAA